MLTELEKKTVEKIVIQNQDFFGRHRVDILLNTKFQLKLIIKDDITVYSENLPMPIHLRKDVFIESAAMRIYGIITVLPSSKNASPNLAQRKLEEKLRLLVDMRKINKLTADGSPKAITQ